MKTLFANRWFLASFFYLSSALNYLDRLVLGAMAPHLMKVLDFSVVQYGDLQRNFYIVYAICSPLMGWVLDKVGLNRGAAVMIGLWSGVLRGYVDSYDGLMLASCLLAAGESAGLPLTAKFAQQYLKPAERAVGAGISQLGLAVGSFSAPVVVNYFVTQGQWQSAFVVTGMLGFIWIPIWLWLSSGSKGQTEPEQAGKDWRGLLRDPGMWGLYVGNVLGMVPYALWSGAWTTIFFTQTHHLSMVDANSYGKWTHLVNYPAALAGGFLSMWLVKRGVRPASARLRVCMMVAAGQMINLAIPYAPTPLLATIGIGASYAMAGMFGVNFYTLPIDRYGHQTAAFAVSLLTSAFGLLQIFISPWIGRMVQQQGFGPVCVLAAVMPLVGIMVVRATRPPEERAG
jgi:ACS family hexuronate transporter-like MFS transporter